MNKRNARTVSAMAVAMLAMGLAGCSSVVDRVTTIGTPPPLSAIKNPTKQPGYKPVRLPMPEPVAYVHQPNSLWRSGARAFFEDQRAARIGDILTVNVTIDDKAELENATSRTRTANEAMGIDQLAGFNLSLARVLPNSPNPSDLIDVDSATVTQGSGAVDREEEVKTDVAAVVTQVLPNGNLVIEGRQEVRVNFEVREIVVAGIVRPEDISAENTIASQKIAEARISYGGRGQITDVQQPRYGQQFLDILLPF
ncbi:MAG: flagellar basal body L-ring protein FlgH [Hyphomicrobiales bacterium]